MYLYELCQLCLLLDKTTCIIDYRLLYVSLNPIVLDTLFYLNAFRSAQLADEVPEHRIWQLNLLSRCL